MNIIHDVKIIGGYSFVFLYDIMPMRDPDDFIIQYMPQNRYENVNGLGRHNHGNGPFCKFKIPHAYSSNGVYAIFVDDEPKYIGECKNLSKRFNGGYGNISPRKCFIGGQITNCRINNHIYEAAYNNHHISIYFFQTTDYKAVERELLIITHAEWN